MEKKQWTYDFDKLEQRRGTDSLKWDVSERELPLWVADMDFQTVPQVKEALVKRAMTGIFGYSIVPDQWYEAYQHWWQTRHQFDISREWLIFCTGVIPAISSLVKRLTNPGDQVLTLTPVYDIFFHSIENHGRHVLECPLHYEAGNYTLDFKDLEEKLKDPLTTLMILCNPHNPVGKVWTKEELAQIGALCQTYHVTVISDEIHCDLTMPDVAYTPFAAASPLCAANSITCFSASKTFNLAGLQSAAVMVPDERLRQIAIRGLNADEIAEPNSFAVTGVVAAFQYGAEWLDDLRHYIAGNRDFAKAYLTQEIPQLQVISQQATYLMWIDCSQLLQGKKAHLSQFIREKTGLYITDGSVYRGNGQQFIRINIACPRQILQEALCRLKEGVTLFMAQ